MSEVSTASTTAHTEENHTEIAIPNLLPSEKGARELDAGISVHLHNVDVAPQGAGLGSVDVAGFVHVLNHTEFDTVALALYVLDLRDGFRSCRSWSDVPAMKPRHDDNPATVPNNARCCTYPGPSRQ